MGWAQITWIAIAAAGIALALAKHGQPTKHDFPAALIGTSLGALLLYAGGFFG